MRTIVIQNILCKSFLAVFFSAYKGWLVQKFVELVLPVKIKQIAVCTCSTLKAKDQWTLVQQAYTLWLGQC